ncbi:hypothetical protein GF867_08965 [Aerococcaceae bacterium DSM 109652]|uniref:Uncharacterized protein n=1 Tax=Fundicoccus ignavus TaxID=2664442 RepID=A0A844C0H5_9LACT|nr:hypothetical protein [Fundicoccus ignavus]
MFKNQENVHVFGQNSAGFTSALTLFYIAENYHMYLATNKIVTLSGETYLDQPIIPDTSVNFKEEDVIEVSKGWLLK